MNAQRIVSNDPQETIETAARFARHLKKGDIVLLQGDLGAGKTTFTKGLAKGLGIKINDVNSPTFILMNYYDGKFPVYHFDLYRLTQDKELKTVEMDEYFYGNGVSVIEWPERLGELAPKEYFQVTLEHRSENQRMIKFSSSGKTYKGRLTKMCLDPKV